MNLLWFYITYICIDILIVYIAFRLIRDVKYAFIGKLLLFFAYLIYVIVAVNRIIEVNVTSSGINSIGGIDANTYRNYFYHANCSLNYFLKNYHGEIGFNFFLWLIYNIFGDFKVFLFVFHSIVFVLYINFINLELKNNQKYLYLLLLSTFIFTSFNTMRNDLAILIWLNIFHLLKKKNYFVSLLLSCITLLFHSSMIIVIPVIILCYLYDMSKIATRGKVIIMLVLSMAAFYFVSVYVLNNYLVNSEYSLYLSDNRIATNTYIYVLFLIIVSMLKIGEIKKLVPGYSVYLVSLLVCLSCYVIQKNFFMAYRMLLAFLGINYIYSFNLLKHILKKNTWINLGCKLVIYSYLFYKVYDLFFVQLYGAGIVRF